MSASPSLRIALAINRGVFAAELRFFENIWRGGAELWVDVGSTSAKIARSLLGFGAKKTEENVVVVRKKT
jgi:hypothetical protein